MADSSSVSNQFNYDVFLSFGGEDTRDTFVGRLYTAMVRNGIRTFKDDDEEESRDSSKHALKSIQESRFSIVIFSESYASSAWCLDELVNIMKCNKEIGQIVLPVFDYDFSRSNLRRQGSVFGELFARYDMEKVRAWSSALVEVANLSGIELIDRRYEPKHVKEIVEIVLSKLGQNATGMKHDKLGDTASSHEDLVGIERRMQEVKALFEVETVHIASRSILESSSPPSSSYDVFLSFRGNDTCKDFADQLYCALDQEGIYTFSGNQRLAWDEPIVSELLKAIEESSIAVVIFSENYASASRCLDELVKIMNCYDGIGQIVLPVYYDVDSSDVRNQKGIFGQAFMQYKPEKVEMWRKALVKAGSLSGWYLKSTPKSHEASIIKNIVDMISSRLVRLPSSVDDNLIGIEPRVEHLTSLLELESGGVHMLGIWGMGGMGKTTLARAVFDRVLNYFDGSCFVENIREVSKTYGLEHIQKEVLLKLLTKENLDVESVYEGIILMRNRLFHSKVLIVLDDVDDKRQLETLAGGINWFGEGSRIIITSRDENVLVAHNITQIYYVKALDDHESIQFLRRHAFMKDDLAKGYEDLVLQVVHYAAGLPLALKVLSSLLCGKSKKEWISTLDRLEAVPEKEIQDALKISYDGLNDDEKNMFLDVACFFIGTKKERAVRILEGCGFSAESGMRLLEQKSLISILDERIQMHDLVRQMGRDIVRQMNPDEPGQRSRLWYADEVSEVLMEKTGTKEIRGIVVDNLHSQDAVDMTEVFKPMKKLRLLQIHSIKKLTLLQGSSYLPNELHWLSWKKYPLQSLPTSFKANKLVGLELVHSNISELWSGVKYLASLKYLNLSYSRKLIKTPNFTEIPCLEKLKLNHCTNLMQVHESIGFLSRLTFLSLRSCRNLETLPTSLGQLKSLSSLDLSGCYKLRSMSDRLLFRSNSQMIKVPSSFGNLESLFELHLDDFTFERLPNYLDSLKKLRIFSVPKLRRWKKFDAKHKLVGLEGDHSSIPKTETSSGSPEQKKEIEDQPLGFEN